MRTSWPAFQQMLAELLEVDMAKIQPDAYLVTDLGIDSIRAVELLLRLEELGLELSPDLAWQIQTVGDAFRCWQQAARSK